MTSDFRQRQGRDDLRRHLERGCRARPADKVDFGYFPLPASDNAADNAVLGGKVELTLAVPSNAKNKAAAMAWLAFFADNYKLFNDKAGFAPPRKASKVTRSTPTSPSTPRRSNPPGTPSGSPTRRPARLRRCRSTGPRSSRWGSDAKGAADAPRRTGSRALTARQLPGAGRRQSPGRLNSQEGRDRATSSSAGGSPPN